MSLKSIPVIIMAGGKGRRLRPYTATFPKPLVPIGDMPILEIVLRQLRNHGYRNITLTLGYLAELIKAYLSQNKGPISDLNFTFIHEEKPTGTVGSLGFMKDELTSTFQVMNGDILTDLQYSELIAHHRCMQADVTIATHYKKVKIEYGVLEENDDGILIGYNEKPVLSYKVAMGISVMEPVVLDYIIPGDYLDLPTLMEKMMADGRKIALYHHPGEWLDIGNHDEYALAQEQFTQNKETYNII